MSASPRKRKLARNDESISEENSTQLIDNPSPRKKLKLDEKTDYKGNQNTEIAFDAPFDIQIGSDQIIHLFASNTVNNMPQNADDKRNNGLISLQIGKSDWKFEFYQLPTDPNDNIYQFLDGLFGDKLCDWKEYIHKHKEDSHKPSNNFVSVIKDNLGVWRGAILSIIYEQHKGNNKKYLIKIPLAGVDLHFRRQNVGSILVDYTVSIIHSIMHQKGNKYEIIVLVIDETQAKSFWRKNQFIPAINHKELIKKEFVLEIETELIIMIYIGDKSTDLVLNNKIIDEFESPKYVNFGQRYCKKHEIEEHEKNMKEWEKKKKELDEKMKHKKDDQDDESDEDFDVEAAAKLLSSDNDDTDDNDTFTLDT